MAPSTDADLVRDWGRRLIAAYLTVPVYAEFHRTIGDYVAALSAARLSITELIEPQWPDWNTATWGGWSPLRGTHLPGTLIIGCRTDGRAGPGQTAASASWATR